MRFKPTVHNFLHIAPAALPYLIGWTSADSFRCGVTYGEEERIFVPSSLERVVGESLTSRVSVTCDNVTSGIP